MKKAYKFIAWFVAGQTAQIVLAILAKVSWMNRPIWFGVASGFLLTVCIYAGAKLTAPKETALTYLDYAEGRHE